MICLNIKGSIEKLENILKKIQIVVYILWRFSLILFFSLIVHACHINTTKSSELYDNETKNEFNDNGSVHIYFMDSPIRMSHEEIGEKRFGASYANSTDSGSFLSSYSEYLEFYNGYAYDPYSDPTRGGGHGTMMAGIITNKQYGISPNTDIKIHSVSRESGDWYKQLNWINNYGLQPGIISISTGTDLLGNNNIILNDIKEIMIEMTNKGFIFVISSGGNFKGPNFPYPTGYPNSHCDSEFPRNFYRYDSISMIITSPVSVNNQIDPYVNTGSCVDFFVKIDNIYYLDSKRDTGGELNFSDLASSPTAPYVAGLIANIMVEEKYRKFTPKQIKNLLVDNSLKNLVKDEDGNMLVNQEGRDNHLIDSNFTVN